MLLSSPDNERFSNSEIQFKNRYVRNANWEKNFDPKGPAIDIYAIY